MGFFDFLKSKPVKTTTNEDQLIYDISGAIIAISDITTDELYEHSKVTDRPSLICRFPASRGACCRKRRYIGKIHPLAWDCHFADIPLTQLSTQIHHPHLPPM